MNEKSAKISNRIEDEIDVTVPVGKLKKTEELYKGLSKETADIKRDIIIYYDGRQHTLRLPIPISNELELKDEKKTSYKATITLDKSGDKPRMIIELKRP